MQSKRIVKMLSKNIEEVVKPVMDEMGFQYTQEIIEDRMEWVFFKEIGQKRIEVRFWAFPDDCIRLNFLCTYPEKPYAQMSLQEIEDMGFSLMERAMGGCEFETEEELKIQLKRLLDVVLVKGDECIEILSKRLSC